MDIVVHNERNVSIIWMATATVMYGAKRRIAVYRPEGTEVPEDMIGWSPWEYFRDADLNAVYISEVQV